MRVSSAGGWSSSDQSPLEAGRRGGSRGWRSPRGWTVAGKHDLLVRVEEGVKGVEKLVLHALFAAKKLDIVDQHQHIDLAILLAEFGHRAGLDGLDEFVGELFAGDVADFAG